MALKSLSYLYSGVSMTTLTIWILPYIKSMNRDYIKMYYSAHTANPSISSLQRITNSTTLNCISTGSPATTVMWTKDDITLNNNAGYQMSQILTDGTTSTYLNLLYISLDPDDLTGLYSCRVMNQIGFSSSETYLIQGKTMSYWSAQFINHN